MPTLNLLVIIPCLNEEEHIENLLNQLLKQSPKKIIVMDGGSTDNTLRILESQFGNCENVIVDHNPKKIQSAAINLAVNKYSDGFTHFVRIDAHGSYPDDYLIQLYSDLLSTTSDSVVVTMATEGTNKIQKVIAEAQNSKLGNGGSSHRNSQNDGRYVTHGHHALMSVDSFKSVAGYDETFVANEDAELDFRLIKAGKKIWLTTKTKMIYYPRSSFMGLFTQYYRYGIGRASNSLKHKYIPSLRQLIPLSVFPLILLSLFSTYSLMFALPVIIWLIACLSVGLYISFKNKKLIYLLSGYAVMIMHLAWSLGFCSRLVFGKKL